MVPPRKYRPKILEQLRVNVQCTRCGEELLGAVNRCWRCGTDFVSPVGPAELPPVRRAPLAASTGPSENTGDDTSSTDLNTDCQGSEVADSGHVDSGFGNTAPVQIGSPFRRGSLRPSSDRSANSSRHVTAQLGVPIQKTRYPRNLAAQGGAVSSISLGFISWIGVTLAVWGAWSPLGPVVTAVLGILMGAWGAFSQLRRVATVGLVISCFAFAVAGFLGAVEVYVHVNGEDPFAPVLDESLND
ncbi:MAG: hypothetical protein CMJ70_24235 [Planctomycetaceae bacterium]|nr:hypothetical protein [Planctomycetaceae bacterium]HAA72553.1 hypothetical protein [Planctomycetaceae bacterium]